MIEIVKPGHKKFKATCDDCGCEFTYTNNDYFNSLNCPCCGSFVPHKLENAID